MLAEPQHRLGNRTLTFDHAGLGAGTIALRRIGREAMQQQKIRGLVGGAFALALALTCGCQSSLTPAARSGAGQGVFNRAKVVVGSLPGAKSIRQRFESRDSTQSQAAELNEQNFSGVQVAMGRSMERAGDLRGAEAAYLAAIRNNPQDSAPLHLLALVREKLGEGASAERLLLQAAELSPSNAEILCDLGYWYSVRENSAAARTYYEQALALQPDFPRAHNNLGMLVARDGDEQSALRNFSAAGLSLAEARTNLGFVNMKQQRWSGARTQLQLALKSDRTLKKAVALTSALDHVASVAGATDVARPVATSTPIPAPTVVPSSVVPSSKVAALDNKVDFAEPADVAKPAVASNAIIPLPAVPPSGSVAASSWSKPVEVSGYQVNAATPSAVENVGSQLTFVADRSADSAPQQATLREVQDVSGHSSKHLLKFSAE